MKYLLGWECWCLPTDSVLSSWLRPDEGEAWEAGCLSPSRLKTEGLLLAASCFSARRNSAAWTALEHKTIRSCHRYVKHDFTKHSKLEKRVFRIMELSGTHASLINVIHSFTNNVQSNIYTNFNQEPTISHVRFVIWALTDISPGKISQLHTIRTHKVRFTNRK